MISEVLIDLNKSQIWKIQDRVKNLTYQKGDEVIIFYAPQTKSCFRDRYGDNPRKLGAKGKVVLDDTNNLVVEFIPTASSQKNGASRMTPSKRISVPKKYVMDVQTWRDIQLEYIFK